MRSVLSSGYENCFKEGTLEELIASRNTPAMKEVKMSAGILGEVEYSQELNVCVTSEDVINPNSIQSVEIAYLNREGSQCKRLFQKNDNTMYNSQEEVILTGAAWIGNKLIELTEEQMSFLKEEYI